MIAKIRERSYTVQDHWFWKEFNTGEWEPTTLEVFDRFLRCGGALLDLGSWIGPTVLYADYVGAASVVAVEGNRASHKQLAANVEDLRVDVQTIPVLLGDGRAVRFGPEAGRSDTSSASRVWNDGMKDRLTTPLKELGLDLGSFSLVKIDIEGSERAILEYVKKEVRCPIWLSLHGSMMTTVDKVWVASLLLGWASDHSVQRVLNGETFTILLEG